MKPLLVIAVALMLVGAALLVADIGAQMLWLAAIAVGVALVAVISFRQRSGGHGMTHSA